MLKHLLLQSIVVILLVESMAFGYSASAEAAPNDLVEAILTGNFDSGTHLTVRAHMIVNI
jgi:hypothetical protein